MNKIKTISCRSPDALDVAVNEFGATHAVFATQTHVTASQTHQEYYTLFTAVIFYKENN